MALGVLQHQKVLSEDDKWLGKQLLLDSIKTD